MCNDYLFDMQHHPNPEMEQAQKYAELRHALFVLSGAVDSLNAIISLKVVDDEIEALYNSDCAVFLHKF